MKIMTENKPFVILQGEDGKGKPYRFEAWNIKDLAGNLENTLQLEFASEDGAVTAVNKEEILKGQVFLAKEEDAFRLVILSDGHRRRWCKHITEIKQIQEDDR